MKEKPNWKVLAAIAFIGVLVFQFAALLRPFSYFDTSVDIGPMYAGYRYAIENGTAHWWYSTWIHTAVDYFRPLASYGHFVQLWVLERYGLLPISAGMMTLYAVFCFSCGLLAYLVTSRPTAAYIAAGFATMFWGATDSAWLSYFPVLDNIACMTLQVLTLCAFITYLRSGKARFIVLTWLAFIASGLFKEQGWIVPVMLGVLALNVETETRIRRTALGHVALIGLAGLLMLKYARFAIGAAPVNIDSSFLVGTSPLDWLWRVLFLAVIVGFVVFCGLRREWLSTPKRRLGTFGVLVFGLLLSLLLAPPHGMPIGTYGVIAVVDGARGLFQIGLLCGALWFCYRVRNPLTIAVACAAIGYAPSYIIGAPLEASRVLFVLPYLLASVSYLIALSGSHLQWRVLRLSARATIACKREPSLP